jgi:hypothetical protein
MKGVFGTLGFSINFGENPQVSLFFRDKKGKTNPRITSCDSSRVPVMPVVKALLRGLEGVTPIGATPSCIYGMIWR